MSDGACLGCVLGSCIFNLTSSWPYCLQLQLEPYSSKPPRSSGGVPVRQSKLFPKSFYSMYCQLRASEHPCPSARPRHRASGAGHECGTSEEPEDLLGPLWGLHCTRQPAHPALFLVRFTIYPNQSLSVLPKSTLGPHSCEAFQKDAPEVAF